MLHFIPLGDAPRIEYWKVLLKIPAWLCLPKSSLTIGSFISGSTCSVEHRMRNVGLCWFGFVISLIYVRPPATLLGGRPDFCPRRGTRGWSCLLWLLWKNPWCWERVKAGGEGDDRGWDGWMASLMRWTWVWVGFRSWWRTWRPGVLQSMGSQRIGHNWVTELKL